MKKFYPFFILAAVFLAANTIFAQNSRPYSTISTENSTELQALVEKAANETIQKFADKNFKAENFAITLIDLRDPKHYKTANFRGEEKIYPASVIKMFYDVAFHQWLADGKIKMTPALERVEKDMIVVSSNEATQYLVDALTDTHNGEELTPEELTVYGEKRDAVNRYFTSLGYKNINVNQKTYGEDLYGRERQWWNAGKNRNMLTTNATAQLLAEIALGKAVSAEHSAQMMELLKRDPYSESKDSDNQATGYTGIALKNIPNAKLWSKAGWTATARHDAAYVETPDGLKFVLVTFTSNFANEREIIPNIARIVIEGLRAAK
jgi:Beta-lactamase enzyme family